MTRRVADRYELAEQIGAGGSARVFAAVDTRLGRRVAVKVLSAPLARSADPRSRERFLREGPTSASFLHRHAVAVFDAGEDADDLYIVMELVDGPSLATVLATRGHLPVSEATRIAAEVLSALAAAHEAGIVHRDVKPGNILLAADGAAKLTDFGIAKRFDEIESSITHTGTAIGTPGYFTPEQATGGPLSPATDVYAVGMLLFEMLTGRKVFSGDAPVAVALAQQQQAAPDVRESRPDVPPALAGVVARALELRPDDRYESAAEMAGALHATWSPPPGPLPESGIQTTVIGTPLDVRSGDTMVMPSPYVAPAPAESTVVNRPRRHVRSAILIAAAALALAAAVVIAARRGTESSRTASSSTTVSVAPASTTTSTPAPSTPAPTPVVDEIVPGFPRPDDLAAFLDQLQSNPALVGTAGAEVAAELEGLLDERSVRKQRDRAKALTGQLEAWATSDQLDPAIALALTELLEPLAVKGKP